MARFSGAGDSAVQSLVDHMAPLIAERSPASPGRRLPSFCAECVTPEGTAEFRYPVIDRDTGEWLPSVMLFVSPERPESLAILGSLAERMQNMQARSANFIVVFGGTADQARAAVDPDRNPCWLLPDPEGKVSRMLLVREFPTTYVMKSGMTVSSVHGNFSPPDSLLADLEFVEQMAAWGKPGGPAPLVRLPGLYTPEESLDVAEADPIVLVFVMIH